MARQALTEMDIQYYVDFQSNKSCNETTTSGYGFLKFPFDNEEEQCFLKLYKNLPVVM